MKQEVLAAVMFFIRFIEKSDTFPRDQLENFKKYLTELLIERFEKHWFPEVPHKGQGYRCIRVNGISPVDLTLEMAASKCGLSYSDLRLPTELTVWVDPSEVCYRLGESEGSYCTLASFPSELSQYQQRQHSMSDGASTASSSSSFSSSSVSSSSSESSPSPSPPATPPQRLHDRIHALPSHHHSPSANQRRGPSHRMPQQPIGAQQQRYGLGGGSDFGAGVPPSVSKQWNQQQGGRNNHGSGVQNSRGKPSPREMNFSFNPNRPMYRCDGPPFPMNPAFYRNMNYNRSYHKNVLRA